MRHMATMIRNAAATSLMRVTLRLEVTPLYAQYPFGVDHAANKLINSLLRRFKGITGTTNR